jgi:hypothetical protein
VIWFVAGWVLLTPGKQCITNHQQLTTNDPLLLLSFTSSLVGICYRLQKSLCGQPTANNPQRTPARVQGSSFATFYLISRELSRKKSCFCLTAAS